MANCRNKAKLLRVRYERTFLWIMLADLPKTSFLRASSSVIWPALRNTFVLPIWYPLRSTFSKILLEAVTSSWLPFETSGTRMPKQNSTNVLLVRYPAQLILIAFKTPTHYAYLEIIAFHTTGSLWGILSNSFQAKAKSPVLAHALTIAVWHIKPSSRIDENIH